mmetsp:Transcript_16011/g.17289  ORF Transcript_16011/g.17289 Transcript_16011/m.17289 type:complete len:98 (-) Transcript_16011:293-586(-)
MMIILMMTITNTYVDVDALNRLVAITATATADDDAVQYQHIVPILYDDAVAAASSSSFATWCYCCRRRGTCLLFHAAAAATVAAAAITNDAVFQWYC